MISYRLLACSATEPSLMTFGRMVARDADFEVVGADRHASTFGRVLRLDEDRRKDRHRAFLLDDALSAIQRFRELVDTDLELHASLRSPARRGSKSELGSGSERSAPYRMLSLGGSFP